jgi:hypothetical protein
MPTLLADPPQVLYLLLGGVLVVAGLVATQRQSRRALAAFAATFFLILALFLIDRVVETPREEAVRRTQVLAMAADAKNPGTFSPDVFAEQLADRVTIASGNEPGKTLTRDEVKKHPFWHTLRANGVHVAAWGFSRDDAKQIDDGTVEIGFMGKGEVGDKQIPAYVRATYARQPDGSFKLGALRTFDPINHKEGLAIPGFP